MIEEKCISRYIHSSVTITTMSSKFALSRTFECIFHLNISYLMLNVCHLWVYVISTWHKKNMFPKYHTLFCHAHSDQIRPTCLRQYSIIPLWTNIETSIATYPIILKVRVFIKAGDWNNEGFGGFSFNSWCADPSHMQGTQTRAPSDAKPLALSIKFYVRYFHPLITVWNTVRWQDLICERYLA